MARTVITAAQWDRIHPDYKTGSARFGTAEILRMDGDGAGFEPVDVEWSNGHVVRHGSRPGYEAWRADIDRAADAVRPWVIEDHDGSQWIDPDCPREAANHYSRLVSDGIYYGYM